jgi:hypothetical protein
MTCAQFEIRIDGTPRTYRDRKDYAMEAARFIKSKNPHSLVEVKDLKPHESWRDRFRSCNHWLRTEGSAYEDNPFATATVIVMNSFGPSVFRSRDPTLARFLVRSVQARRRS